MTAQAKPIGQRGANEGSWRFGRYNILLRQQWAYRSGSGLPAEGIKATQVCEAGPIEVVGVFVMPENRRIKNRGLIAKLKELALDAAERDEVDWS
jgi:hypothetical protein